MQLRFGISLIFILSFFFSCTRTSRRPGDLEKQAVVLMAEKPDSALKLIDSILHTEGDGQVDESAQIRLLLMRQQVFAGRRQMDSVISSGVRIRRLAQLSGDSLSMAKSLLPVRGEVSMEDQRELEPYLAGAARTFAAIGLRYEEAVIVGLMGAIATRKGQFAESMQLLFRARDIHEAFDSVKPLFAVYMNIGNDLSGMGDLRGSIGFYQKAARVGRRLNDSIRIATALMNEGTVRSDLRSFDSSRICFNEALAALPASGGAYTRMQIDYNLATVLQREDKLPAAEAAFRKVVDEATEMGDPFAIGMGNMGLAGVLGKTGRVGPAIELVEATLRQQESMGLGYYTVEMSDKLVKLYKLDGRYREAVIALERLKLLSDSLMGADKQRDVKELVVKYDFDRQEQDKEMLRQQVRQGKRFAGVLIFAVVVLVALGVLLYQRNRNQRELTVSYQRLLTDYLSRRDASGPRFPADTHQPAGEEEKYPHTPETDGTVGGLQTMPPDEISESDRLIYRSVLQYFSTDKPFLNPDLKVEDVANRVQAPPRRLSLAVKSSSGLGFTDFVNGYRIAEATRLMDTPGAASLKMEIIAARAGFNSRQQFRRVFEQITGVTPAFYRSRLSDEPSV